MKTTIYKSIAIITLGVLTLNLNAQNTKSLSKYTDNYLMTNLKSSNIFSSESEELSSQIMKLVELVKYNPRTEVLYFSEPSMNNNISAITYELKKYAKFHPEESMLSSYDETILDEVSVELKNELKFKPTESFEPAVEHANEGEIVLSDILTELSEVVKFKPAVIQ